LEAHSVQKIKEPYDFSRIYGKEISDRDYKEFIEPYTGLNHLSKIRQKLSEIDIREYKKYSLWSSSSSSGIHKGEHEPLFMLSSVLSRICNERSVSYARLLTLKDRRKKIMKILWVLGIYGKVNLAD
jgi:hypothetical protein